MLSTVSVGSVDSEEIVNHHNNNIIIMYKQDYTNNDISYEQLWICMCFVL